MPRTRASMNAALRLNPNGWRRLCAVAGWPSTEAAARGVGVASTTITRALRDETQPSGVLLAHVLAASRAHGIPDDAMLDVVVPAPTETVGASL